MADIETEAQKSILEFERAVDGLLIAREEFFKKEAEMLDQLKREIAKYASADSETTD